MIHRARLWCERWVRWLCVGLVVGSAMMIVPMPVQASPIVFSRLPACSFPSFGCRPGDAVPPNSFGTNGYFPDGVITPFRFSERTLIDQVDFWSYWSVGPVSIMIQTVADVGDPPGNLDTAPFVYSATSGADIHATLFGYDPNCSNPLNCAYYNGFVTLNTPFIAEAGVAYYFRSSVNLLVGFQTVGQPSGGSWQTEACGTPSSYCPAIGGAFVLHGEAATVPEPGTLVLVGTGLLAAAHGLGRHRRR